LERDDCSVVVVELDGEVGGVLAEVGRKSDESDSDLTWRPQPGLEDLSVRFEYFFMTENDGGNAGVVEADKDQAPGALRSSRYQDSRSRKWSTGRLNVVLARENR
jgi:hypothetical protein